MREPTDLLMCVGPDDVHRLFPLALQLAATNLDFDGSVHLVGPDPDRITAIAKTIDCRGRRLFIHADQDVLPPAEASLAGWLRQQLIKLRADEVCQSRHIWCLGSDTLVVRPVQRTSVTRAGEPIIFYNRYRYPNPHLEYERRRVLSVARLLKVEPTTSYLLGDFIMDLTLFDRRHLMALRQYLARLYQNTSFADVLPTSIQTVAERRLFGEWTLYAVFVLDVLRFPAPVRNSGSRFVSQVHSEYDLVDDDAYGAAAIHFVSKAFEVKAIVAQLARRDLLESTDVPLGAFH